MLFTVKDIEGSVVSFSGCVNIENTADVPGTLAETVTNGDYRVGIELAPGKYSAVVDTDSVIVLGSVTQYAENGDVIDLAVGDAGKVVFTVKDAAGSIVSFSGFSEITTVG